MFWQLDQIFSTFGKSVFFPLKSQKHLVLDIQDVRQIAQNAGHIAQNVGHTMQNDVHTMRNVGRNTLNVCQGQKWGLEEPPRGPPPTPILEKTLVSRNDF